MLQNLKISSKWNLNQNKIQEIGTDHLGLVPYRPQTTCFKLTPCLVYKLSVHNLDDYIKYVLMWLCFHLLWPCDHPLWPGYRLLWSCDHWCEPVITSCELLIRCCDLFINFCDFLVTRCDLVIPLWPCDHLLCPCDHLMCFWGQRLWPCDPNTARIWLLTPDISPVLTYDICVAE